MSMFYCYFMSSTHFHFLCFLFSEWYISLVAKGLFLSYKSGMAKSQNSSDFVILSFMSHFKCLLRVFSKLKLLLVSCDKIDWAIHINKFTWWTCHQNCFCMQRMKATRFLPIYYSDMPIISWNDEEPTSVSKLTMARMHTNINVVDLISLWRWIKEQNEAFAIYSIQTFNEHPFHLIRIQFDI